MYEVNVEILKMLRKTEFAPTSAKVLGLFINTPKLYGNLSNYFKRYAEWFLVVYNEATISDRVITLYSMCNTVYEYYSCLTDFIEESSSFNKMYKELADIRNFYLSDDFNKTIRALTQDNLPDDIWEALTKNTFPDESKALAQNNLPEDLTVKLLSILRRVFCDCKDCVEPVTVRKDVTRDEIDLIYKKTLDFFVWFFKEIYDLGHTVYFRNKKSWPGRAISDRYCIKPFTIDKPALALISFCSDTTRYYSSNQKVISASLVKTNNHKCFDDRSFGFLYEANVDNFVATSYRDLQSATEEIRTTKELFEYVLRGEMLLDLNDRIMVTGDEMLPLYNQDDILAKTEKYNEILLRPSSQPFGIFVWKEKLENCKKKVQSLCTVLELPLYIANENGSLLVIPWRDVFTEI